MESLGIGRPSTYATIVGTIKDRGYVVLKDKKFEPTEIGIETTDILFSSILFCFFTSAFFNALTSTECHLHWTVSSKSMCILMPLTF